jgi:hypothetical protein
MILVKRTATNLTDGFTILQAFQERLQSEWEPRFLHQYTCQQEAYREAKRRYESKSWSGQIFSAKPQPPKRPLRFSKLIHQFYEPIVLRRLAAMSNDNYLAACRLHMNHPGKADADIFLVGPKGYWYFMVKGWKGYVRGVGDDKAVLA